ncbi:MAG: hypothetical protein ABUT39_08925 [Acidobacteriota bacterium]
MTRPMLDGVELPQAQRIASEDGAVLARHGVPALEGDFLQDLGCRATRVTLTGVLAGPEAGEGLQGLREKLRAAAPVPFVSDIGTATKVDRVLIEELGVRELAGRPARFEYSVALREHIPPPPVEETAAPELRSLDEEIGGDASDAAAAQVAAASADAGTLEVRVELGEGSDYSGIVVAVEGRTIAGEPLSAWSGEQEAGLYRFVNLPAGDYTVRLEMQ